MESIIEELIRIEDQANEYMAESEKGRKALAAHTREQLAALKTSLEAEAREKARQLAEGTADETQAALAAIEDESANRLRALEQDFAENRAAWEKSLVERILYAE